MTFKNHVPWNKGIPCSEETKLKISEGNKGKQLPEDIKKKISESMKGKEFSKEHEQNLRGHIPWNKGISHSEKTRQKLRENNARYWLGKKFSAEHRKNMSLARKGLPSPLKGRKLSYMCTQEHRRNLSIAVKRWWARRKKRHGNQTTK